MSIIRYQDPLVDITDEAIVFHHYYFPFGQDRRIPFVDIAKIESKPPSFFGGSWRIWGSGNFITWFPCDFSRPFRDRIFFVHLRDSRRRIGFTAQDSAAVTAILKAKGLLQEKRSV